MEVGINRQNAQQRQEPGEAEGRQGAPILPPGWLTNSLVGTGDLWLALVQV